MLKCRIARLAATFRPSRACGSETRRSSRHLASHNRNFSGSCLALGTNTRTSHTRPSAHHQDNTACRPAYLLLQTNNAVLAGARSMNLTTHLYDWRAFTAPGAQLHYIRTEGAANERIARIASRQTPFAIGLDFEWRPTFVSGRAENPIALVQVACDDEILLVHVSAMQGELFQILSLFLQALQVADINKLAFPTKLRDLLESSNSTKVGVGIQCKWA